MSKKMFHRFDIVDVVSIIIYHYAYSTDGIFLQDFLIILKRFNSELLENLEETCHRW